jgi:rare lipoprotein A
MVSVLIFSCSSSIRYASNPAPVHQSSLSNSKFYSGQIITGKSSYYGSKFHGSKTANGEIFDMYKLTAAHRELPFETLLKVTNTKNNKSVIVHVNDRGPFVTGRILDLSYGAAKKIDMINEGVADVILEIIRLGKS